VVGRVCGCKSLGGSRESKDDECFDFGTKVQGAFLSWEAERYATCCFLALR
jgi:hypothetical protein